MNLSLKAKCCLSLLIGLGLSLLSVSLAQAQCPNDLCYVDADGLSQTPDGISWTTAYTNLQDALAVAEDGDEIWVAEGVYYPDEGGGKTNNDRTASFGLKNGVKIYGGFAGTETERRQRQPRAKVTVLSGDIDGNDGTDGQGVVTATANIRGANAYNVIYNSGVSSTAVLDGFTITAGHADDGSNTCPASCGGGMYNDRSNPEMSQVNFSGNRARFGGGMYNTVSSRPEMSQVSFSGNRADDHGGGMYNDSSSNPEMSQVSFSDNRARFGGGMYNDSSSNPEMSQVSFSDNRARFGGGMYNDSSSNPEMSQVSFSDNRVDNNGGGMFNQSNSRPEMSQVSFSGNRARFGGGMYNISSNPEMSQVSFSGNSANAHGGGMYNNSSHPEMSQVSFSGNSAATHGGGMYNSNSRPEMSQVSFSGNSAQNDGGGMYNTSSSPHISNSIFWQNAADRVSDALAQIHNFGNSSPVIRYTLIQGSGGSGSAWVSSLGEDGGHNLAADPLFQEPVDPNNAPTRAGNLRLKPGCFPAIDAGDDHAARDEVDLDGAPRIQGAGVDLGAYESTPAACVSLSKAVSPAWVELGQRVTYTLVLSNRGLVSDTVRLSDTLPSGVEFAAWVEQQGAKMIDDELSWQGTVPTGESITITFVVINLNSSGTIINRAQFRGSFQTGSSSVSHTVFRRRLYVDADVKSPLPDGLSWRTAYPNLQDALAEAADGDEIWVAEGVYYPDEGGGQTNDDVRASFAMTDGVKIYGGFAGTETERRQRQPRANLTVLSGDIDGNDGTDGQGVVTAADNIRGDNAYTVIYNSGVSSTAVLDGFTITAGQADVGGVVGCPNECGGGMYNDSSSPVINQVSFSGNSAATHGGGMYNSNSRPEMSQVSFSGNSAATHGGGMYNSNSRPEMSQVSFSGNRANHGGGMYNVDSSPVINQVSFSGNSAADSGGGMYNIANSRLEMSQVSFSGNSAAGSGGGMFNHSSDLHIVNSIFWQNARGSQMDAPAQIYNGLRSSPVISDTLIQGSGSAGDWLNTLGNGGHNLLDADPLFREPISPTHAPTTTGNLRLEPGSPAIDAGDNRAARDEVDLDGAPRIQGAGVDLGAYEAPGPIVSLSKAVSPAWVELDQRVTYTLVLSNSGLMSDSVRLSDPLPSGVEFAAWVAQGGAQRHADEVSWQGPVTAGESISFTFVVTNLILSGSITNRAQFRGSLQTGSSSVSHSVFRRLYVDADVSPTMPDGLSWTTAYPNLQDALAEAVYGDEIWVAAGVYYPDEGGGQTNDDVRASFALKNGVKIYGGFAGTETERRQRQPRANVTVLSGDIDGNDRTDGQGVVTANIIGDNAYNVIRNSGVNRTAVLDGFTITAGHADVGGGNTCPNNCGGGMYNHSSSPQINQISFSGNRANDGGGMYNDRSSNPEMSQVSFSDNYARYRGGGMFNSASSPEMSQVSFSGNFATRSGGGMYNVDSNPEMSQVSFSGNSAVGGGGGMFNINSSSPEMSQVSFSGNYAGGGGGMFNINSSSPEMSQVSFSGNRADNGGGMYNDRSSNPQIVNSIFWGNAASQIVNSSGSSPVISYTLIQGSGGSSAWVGSLVGRDGGHNLDADPQFREPIDPADAPTTTGNLRLEPGSPAIDAGDNNAARDEVDLDGAPRIQGAGVDLGAYETSVPDISLSKAVSPVRVEPDQRVTYTL